VRVVKPGETPPSREDDLLEIIDSLCKDILSGKVVGVAAVGIEADDNATTYTASIRGQPRVSKLKMLGAISLLLHNYQCGIGDTPKGESDGD
jgi:hypothetical protein